MKKYISLFIILFFIILSAMADTPAKRWKYDLVVENPQISETEEIKEETPDAITNGVEVSDEEVKIESTQDKIESELRKLNGKYMISFDINNYQRKEMMIFYADYDEYLLDALLKTDEVLSKYKPAALNKISKIYYCGNIYRVDEEGYIDDTAVTGFSDENGDIVISVYLTDFPVTLEHELFHSLDDNTECYADKFNNIHEYIDSYAAGIDKNGNQNYSVREDSAETWAIYNNRNNLVLSYTYSSGTDKKFEILNSCYGHYLKQ